MMARRGEDAQQGLSRGRRTNFAHHSIELESFAATSKLASLRWSLVIVARVGRVLVRLRPFAISELPILQLVSHASRAGVRPASGDGACTDSHIIRTQVMH